MQVKIYLKTWKNTGHKRYIAVEDKRKILCANNPFLQTSKTELFFYF